MANFHLRPDQHQGKIVEEEEVSLSEGSMSTLSR